jgi:hypothetical protein
MNENSRLLAYELARHEEQLKSLNSYIKELSTITTQYGTDSSQFETDLMEARHNVKYYESEVERMKKELAESDQAVAAPDEPYTVPLLKQGIGALILTAVSFVAGAILASKLSSGPDSKDTRQGE